MAAGGRTPRDAPIAAALTYTCGLQGVGGTKSPLYISLVSRVVLPLGICFVIQQRGLRRGPAELLHPD